MIQFTWNDPLYILKESHVMRILSQKIRFVWVNSVDPDEMPHLERI